MSDRDDIIRKVKALLAKENAPGTTKEEVAAAIAMATRLLEREGLTRAALDIQGTSQTVEEEIKIANDPLWQSGANRRAWRNSLAGVLTDNFGCWYYTSGGSIKIVGQPTNIDTIRYLFAYCEQEIDRLTKEQCAGEGKTYSNNFRLGCVDSIKNAIRNERASERESFKKSATNNSSALVLVNSAIAKMDAMPKMAMQFAHTKLNFGKAKPMSMRTDYGARMHGQHASKDIYPGSGKSKAIGGSNKRLSD